MNAPDKIIFAPHQISDEDLDIQEIGHNGAEEYIRKDALLEWVKLAYGKVSMNPFDCSEAFEELLNKVGYEE